VHVDDLAAGLLLIHDKGPTGEQYVLGGEIATLREVVRRAAALAGRRPPLLSTPSWMLSAVGQLGGLIGRAMAGAPNLAEMVRASNCVTYWATDAKARVELGYRPRDLAAGLPTLLPSV
jgi:nucleoside-diphosphate-sugar epimerase